MPMPMPGTVGIVGTTAGFFMRCWYPDGEASEVANHLPTLATAMSFMALEPNEARGNAPRPVKMPTQGER